MGKAMNEIVCATRGGEGSRAVQLAAIKQAKESGKPLVFPLCCFTWEYEMMSAMLWNRPFVKNSSGWARLCLYVAKKRAQEAGLETETVIRVGTGPG